MRGVADYVNEEKKKSENRQKPLMIYQLLQIDKDVPPHRTFVHDGTYFSSLFCLPRISRRKGFFILSLFY